MADVGKAMYFLVTMPTPRATRQFHQSATGTPLGNVALGGIISCGAGIPRETLRVYGSYALVYSLGNGEYRNAQRQLTLLRPGDLIIVFPDIAHQYGPTLSHRADVDEEWVRKARTLLEANLEGELYVENVAQRLGMSPETFRKKFARLTGTSPWRYRLVHIIDQACRLVHEGQLTSKEIAARLGFSDEFRFSRRFKQITGYSPSQFRALVPRSH